MMLIVCCYECLHKSIAPRGKVTEALLVASLVPWRSSGRNKRDGVEYEDAKEEEKADSRWERLTYAGERSKVKVLRAISKKP